MSKTAITRLFVSAVVAVFLGVVLEFAAVMTTLAGGVISFGGPTFIQITGGSATWIVMGLLVSGWLVLVGGAIAGVLSWIGALLNTSQLDDKTWFVVLLVLGVVSFGFVAMVAYVVAGPDGSRPGLARADGAAAANT